MSPALPAPRGTLTPEQVSALLQPIDADQVDLDGPDGLARLRQEYVRAELTRVFGFGGFSTEILNLTEVRSASFIDKNDAEPERKKWFSIYRIALRLTVYAGAGVLGSWDAAAVAGSIEDKQIDAHQNAISIAEGRALMKAAINLGDRFGLSLYADGSTEPIVGTMPLYPPSENAGQSPDPGL